MNPLFVRLCVCVCVSVSPTQFLSEVEAWCKVCSEGGLPSEMQELELAIHRHQSLYEQVTQAYTELKTGEREPQEPKSTDYQLPPGPERAGHRKLQPELFSNQN